MTRAEWVDAMITAEQLVFTSCRYAMGGGSGFQVKSHSPGLASGDLNTIIQRSDYQRPLPAPGTPDDAPADFPVAVRWYALPSGGRALTRIVYLGSDHTGRPGNFIAHTLAFPAVFAGRVDPIDWLGWDGWLDALPPGADDTPDVAVLAQARWVPTGVGEPPPAPDLDGATLAHALAALFEAVERGQPLVLLGAAASNVEGMRLLARCLPRTYIANTEFSTYEHSLRRLPALAMTVEGTSIDTRAGPQHGFVGVPCTLRAQADAAAAPGSAAGRSYGGIAARIVFERRELLPRFRQLLSQVDLPIGPDLAALAQVFLLIETGEPPAAAPLDLLRVVLGRLDDPAHAALVPALLARMPEQVPDHFEDRLLLARAWAHALGQEGVPARGQAAARAFLHLLLAALSGWPGQEGVVDEVHDRMAAVWGGDFDELVLQAAGRERAAVQAAFGGASLPGACAMLQSMSAWLGGAAAAPEMEVLVHAVTGAPDGMQRFQALVRQMPGAEHRAGLLEMASRTPGMAPAAMADLLGRTLAAVASGMPTSEVAQLRARVPVPMLMMEWQAALSGSDPVAAHAELSRAFEASALFDRLSKAQRITLQVATARAFARVEADEPLFGVLDGLEQLDALAELPRRERTSWLRLINDRLRLDAAPGEARQRRLQLLALERQRLDATLRPDRPALIELLQSIERGDAPDEGGLALLADLQAVSEPERRHACALLLTCAFQGLTGKRPSSLHDALMTGALRSLGNDTVAYGRALDRLVQRGQVAALAALLSWWFCDPAAGACERLWAAVARDLAGAARRIDDTGTAPPIIGRVESMAARPNANLVRVEHWRKAYETGPEEGLLRTAGRLVSGLLGQFGRKKP